MVYPISQLPVGIHLIFEKNNLFSDTSDSHSVTGRITLFSDVTL
jgi:hypothetical protein